MPLSLEYCTRFPRSLPAPLAGALVRVMVDYTKEGEDDQPEGAYIREIFALREAGREPLEDPWKDWRRELARRWPREWEEMRREALEQARHLLLMELG